MKPKKPSDKDLLASCRDEIDPDDGLDPRAFLRQPSPPRVTNRKALQLSAQVKETLEFALAWECGDGILQGLTVASVVPAPNTTRLLVTVRLPDGPEKPALSQVLEHLSRASGRLRAEIAAVIHRKRVPELTFRIAVD